MDFAQHPLIEVNPEVMVGKPVIRGTRITVELILEELAAGTPVEDFEIDYGITRDDVLAALQFAADIVGDQYRAQSPAA